MLSTSRPDFSHGLIHFCRNIPTGSYFPTGNGGDLQLEDNRTAFENLQSILSHMKIHGSTSRTGGIRGERSAVCFCEIPLTSLKAIIDGHDFGKYSKHGIIISGKSLFPLGGRPAIYLPDKELELLPASLKWRSVRFNPPDINFSYEREWRSPGDLDLNKVDGYYVLVKTDKEMRLILSQYQSRPKFLGCFCTDQLRSIF